MEDDSVPPASTVCAAPLREFGLDLPGRRAVPMVIPILADADGRSGHEGQPCLKVMPPGHVRPFGLIGPKPAGGKLLYLDDRGIRYRPSQS